MIEAFNNNIKTRFEDNDIDTITFLYKILIVSDENEIKLSDLQSKLKNYSDVLNFDRLINEIPIWASYKKVRSDINWRKISVLSEKFGGLDSLNSTFQHVSIVLKLYLVTPVGVPIAERSFSCLRLLKNYLRSTMKEQRLNDCAICKIEYNSKFINFEELVDDFFSIKHRKI